ncbi:MAG TPA: cellulase family glycosylhydrolase, partial [Candidatus Binatus sp.]|nr:cellulase family glycosylhydrolase [Candidatus Binatus sp.]
MNSAGSIILALTLVLLVVQAPVNPVSASSPNNLGLSGWGGSGLKTTDCLYTACNSTWPVSAVFPGQASTTFEMEASKLHSLNYNIIRISFNPGGPTFPTLGTTSCAPDISSNNFGIFNATQLQRGILIANYYALRLIVDYHSYSDMNSTYRTCWLTGWASVISQFRNSYTFIIWEPLNEPSNLGGGSTWANLNLLANGYNAWISQARSLGDTHYVVVEN